MTRDPIEEAADPTTPAERLEELGGSDYPTEVRQVAMRNPNLALSTLLIALEAGTPDAWANPSVPFALLEGIAETAHGARIVYIEAVREGRQELASVLYDQAYPLTDAWWQSPALTPITAGQHLLQLGLTAGVQSTEHRRAVRLGRDAIGLIALQPYAERSDPHRLAVDAALDDVERWLEGREVDLDATLEELPEALPAGGSALSPQVGPLVRRLVQIAQGDVDSMAMGGLLNRVRPLLLPPVVDTQTARLRSLIRSLFPHYPLPVGFSP